MQRLLLVLLQLTDLIFQCHQHLIFLDERFAIIFTFSLHLLLDLSLEAQEAFLRTARYRDATLIVSQAAGATFLHSVMVLDGSPRGIMHFFGPRRIFLLATSHVLL